MKTPKKIIFPKKKQKEILSKVKKMLRPISKNESVVRILIGGSLAKKKLGRYEREYHGRFYSDIDVFVIVDGKIRMPSSFKKDFRLPERIAEVTRQICDRYVRKRKLEGKLPVHVHVFNPKIHNGKLALKCDFPINRQVNKKDAILIYERKKK